jgi:hypothetical protein
MTVMNLIMMENSILKNHVSTRLVYASVYKLHKWEPMLATYRRYLIFHREQNLHFIIHFGK